MGINFDPYISRWIKRRLQPAASSNKEDRAKEDLAMQNWRFNLGRSMDPSNGIRLRLELPEWLRSLSAEEDCEEAARRERAWNPEEAAYQVHLRHTERCSGQLGRALFA